MASCFFLLKQFEDVLVYLKSIKTYLASDDDFNWNYGIHTPPMESGQKLKRPSAPFRARPIARKGPSSTGQHAPSSCKVTIPCLFDSFPTSLIHSFN